MVSAGPGVSQPFDARDRYYVDAEFEIPMVGSAFMRYVARAHLDLATDFKGPSEVRVSLLASLDPSLLSCLFGGKCPTTASNKTTSAPDK